MLKALLRTLAWLPLPVLHAAGSALGMAMYLTDRKFARRVRNHLQSAHIAPSQRAYRRLVRRNARETGKAIVETLAIWFRPAGSALGWVRECRGWSYVESALAQQQGLVFLTPHLGCYEITALYYASHQPISVLFRPPRQSWLAPLIDEGRNRSRIQLAPTTLSGVRSLLKALRRGEAIGILPDQVPEAGEGEWATFFGRPAYTMTLVGKLAASTAPRVLLAFGERLSWGRGYIIHIHPLAGEPTPQNINDGIEQLVRQKPEQYLWSYRRYKTPKLARPAPPAA